MIVYQNNSHKNVFCSAFVINTYYTEVLSVPAMAWKMLHHPLECEICCAHFRLMRLGENASLEWRYLKQKTPGRLLKSAFFNKIQKFIGKGVILVGELDNFLKRTIFLCFMSKWFTFMIFYKILLISTKFKSVILQTLTRSWRIGRELIFSIGTSWSFIIFWQKNPNFSWDFLLSRNLTLVKDYLQNLTFYTISQIDQ